MKSTTIRRTAISIALTIGAIGAPAMLATPAGSAPGEPSAPQADPPTPTAARPGRPTSLAAVGDSISQSTGTGALAAENPKNSWATGWEVNSLAARIGVTTGNRYNLSANGDKMIDFAPQIQNGKSGGSGDVPVIPTNTGLVVVELGGNDLCKDTVAAMTSVETYRAQFVAGLNAVKARAPEALIQVMSVPDIYNLWYIRGAPQHVQYHPEPQSSQASGINGARFYWDGLTSIGVKFPCQSLLADPDSYDPEDRQRRADVRARNQAYNQVLSEECAKVLRCDFDDNQLFFLTSNRQYTDGPLLPQAQWGFTDMDISRNTADFCPIPGLVGGGCGDHFHPSKQGQGKIADVATVQGRNYTDTTYPTAGASVVPSGRAGNANLLTAAVQFSGSDAAGLRGQEVRVHNPDGTKTGWTQHLGVAPNLTLNKIGTSYVEVRSLDVNGNLSASTITPVTIVSSVAPDAPNVPTLTASGTGLTVKWAAPFNGNSTITRYDVVPYYGIAPGVAQTPIPVTGALQTAVPAPPAGVVARYRVQAVNAIGTGPLSGASVPTVAPFATLDAFVRQQHKDFTMYTPQQAEVTSNATAIDTGAMTPGALAKLLSSSAWFDGAYGPSIRLYRAYFLRIPDPSGIDFWVNRRRNGQTLDKISQQFSQSSEFQRRYGSLTNAQFIDQIYNNVFGRDPDPSGRDFYLKRLNDGRWTRGQVVLQFSESNEYKRLTGPLVISVELARGMNGKAPNQALVDTLVDQYELGGVDAVFNTLVATPAYRTRVTS